MPFVSFNWINLSSFRCGVTKYWSVKIDNNKYEDVVNRWPHQPASIHTQDEVYLVRYLFGNNFSQKIDFPKEDKWHQSGVEWSGSWHSTISWWWVVKVVEKWRTFLKLCECWSLHFIYSSSSSFSIFQSEQCTHYTDYTVHTLCVLAMACGYAVTTKRKWCKSSQVLSFH